MSDIDIRSQQDRIYIFCRILLACNKGDITLVVSLLITEVTLVGLVAQGCVSGLRSVIRAVCVCSEVQWTVPTS